MNESGYPSDGNKWLLPLGIMGVAYEFEEATKVDIPSSTPIDTLKPNDKQTFLDPK